MTILGFDVGKWISGQFDSAGSSDRDLVYYRVQIATWTGVFLAAGLGLVLLYGEGRVVGLVWALACFGVGAALGFLFGIPRTVQRGAPRRQGGGAPATNPPKPDQPKPEPGKAEQDDYQQYVNTNLEDISDWLTKIIVGLTLVEFRDLTTYFRDAAALFAAGLGNPATPGHLAFAQGLMVYFTVLGFLCSYLITRLFLSVALRIADQTDVKQLKESIESVAEKVKSVDQKVEAVKQGMGAGGGSGSGSGSGVASGGGTGTA
jgi:hypothetical protein